MLVFHPVDAAAAESSLPGGPAGVAAAGAGCTDRGMDGSPLRFCPCEHLESNCLMDCAGPAEQTGSCQVAAILFLITRGLAASPPAKL